MAFYGFYTKLSDFAAGRLTTNATFFDVNYVPQAVYANNNEACGIAWETPLTDVWIHFNWYPGAAWSDSSDTGRWMQIFNAQGRNIVNADLNTNNPNQTSFGIADSGSGWTYASYLSTTDALLQTIDIHIRINDAGTNYVDVYIDEVLTWSANSAWASATGITRCIWAHEDTGDASYYSEVMVADEDTRGLRLAELAGDSAGNGIAWTGDYTDVVERGDGKAMYSTVAAERESWGLSTYAGAASPTAVRGVFVQAYGKAGTSGPSKIDPYLRVNSTDYDASLDVAPDPSIPTIAEWANDPDTAIGWDTADFATIESGIQSIT